MDNLLDFSELVEEIGKEVDLEGKQSESEEVESQKDSKVESFEEDTSEDLEQETVEEDEEGTKEVKLKEEPGVEKQPIEGKVPDWEKDKEEIQIKKLEETDPFKYVKEWLEEDCTGLAEISSSANGELVIANSEGNSIVVSMDGTWRPLLASKITDEPETKTQS